MALQKDSTINDIKIRQAIRSAVFFVFAAIAHFANGQKPAAYGLDIVSYDSRSLRFEYSVDSLHALPAADGYSTIAVTPANSHSNHTGLPMLPILSHIAYMPCGAAHVVVEQAVWDTVELASLGCTTPLRLAPEPQFKNTQPADALSDSDIRRDNSNIRWADSLLGRDNVPIGRADSLPPLVEFSPLGSLRGSHLARLTISPVRYNPAEGTICVCRKLKASVVFDNDDSLRPSASPQRNAMLRGLPLLAPVDAKSYSYPSHDSEPELLLVATPQRFQATLSPLLQWKREEGYLVEELLVDSMSREEIKTLLQQRYDTATDAHPAPLYILLVGDAPEVQVWNGRQHIPGLDVHRTDLYYAEYTGDYLPDALLGRIPVGDTAELRAVVDKILAYEQFRLADSSFLNRCLLVAGKEETPPAPTTTNGQVNYAKNALLARNAAIDTLCFYNPASDSLADVIRRHLGDGVGLVNYTAHCSSRGWRNPTLTIGDADTLMADGMPFVAINNCCRSNDFLGDCFGEHLLRTAKGGAVGVIGASSETLWNEDYYWCVGGTGDPLSEPVYDSSRPGAYDRWLHTHGEAASEQARTLSQIVVAGNWAVACSGSQFADFYWEIYALLGDPTLMPYVGVPQRQSLTVDTIAEGDSVIFIHGTPGARVAATWRDTLLGLCTVDSAGNAAMALRQPFGGNITITATGQCLRPLQLRITDGNDDTTGTGVATTTPRGNIAVFPNPARGTLTFSGFAEPTTVYVYDTKGREVMRFAANAGETVHRATAGMGKGLFFARTVSANPSEKNIILRIIVQ